MNVIIMSVRKVLAERRGVNITTPPSPVREFQPGDEELLKITEKFCIGFDNNMLVESPRFTVLEVDLPEWLETDVWCDNFIRWNRLLSNKNLISKFGEKSVRFIDYPGNCLEAIESLCKTKKFRSEFRKSLFEQLISWMEQEPPVVLSPFSERQWAALLKYVK